MTNFQVYKKTLSYSLVMFGLSLLALAILAGIMSGGYFLFDKYLKTDGDGLIGLAVGFVVGIIFLILFNIFVTNRIKAAQIAMMTKGVVDDKLPEHTFKEGFKEVKGRFGKLTLFFMVTGAIKGIFRQLGRNINRVGRAVGGKTGESITSIIDSAIQTLVAYLCDCCLGWVMYHREKKMSQAACEGAVIFFKHGKTLLKNAGRIFGIAAVSFLVIGGAFFGISYLILNGSPMFQSLTDEIAALFETGDLPEFFKTPVGVTIIVSAFIAIMLWTSVHSVLIRPFILIGVLRNYMKAGLAENITDADLAELESKSPKFAKLRQKEVN